VLGTKGAHIVVRLPDRYQGFGVATLHRGGMPFYCLPLDGDRFVFGPTETLHGGDASRIAATDEDIDFLLAEAKYVLPGLHLTRRDIEFTWAGVRPLTFDLRQPMGRRTREIHDLASRGFPGVLAMTAGPVMSHMSAGREMCEAVRSRLPPSGVNQHRAGASRRPSAPIELRFVDAEEAIRHAATAEHARDLKGILYTRTGLAWGRYLERKAVEDVAATVSPLLGWSPQEAARQVCQFLDYQETEFGVRSVSSGSKQMDEMTQTGEQRKWHQQAH
jgi:glycerol-3-phosphate dehydrogenase